VFTVSARTATTPSASQRVMTPSATTGRGTCTGGPARFAREGRARSRGRRWRAWE
jgi:hypothetical protein